MSALESLVVPFGALASAVAAGLTSWYNGRVESGRILRTIEQVSKICDLVERLQPLEDGLANRPATDSLRLLIEESSKALREDFKRERQLLPKWQSTSSRLFSLMLLSGKVPRWEWPLRLIFHFLLALPVFIAVRGIAVGQWIFSDSIAVFVSLGAAALMRLTIMLLHRGISGRVKPGVKSQQ